MTTSFQALATLLPMCNLAEATMSRISLVLLLAIMLMGPACGYSRNYMNGTGMPKVTQLSPSSAVASGAFVLTVTWLGFWHGFIGVLGHDDADDGLRIHFSIDGEYHGRGHYEFWQRPGLRALGRGELECHDFHDYAITMQPRVAAMGPETRNEISDRRTVPPPVIAGLAERRPGPRAPVSRCCRAGRRRRAARPRAPG